MSDQAALPSRQKPSVALSSVLHLLIVAVVALLPFQKFAIEVATTRVDWANVILVLIAILSVPIMLKRGYNGRFLSFIFLYLFIQLLMFILGPTSGQRFFAAFMWLTSVLLVYGARKQIRFNSRILANVSNLAAVTVASSLLYQYFLNGIDRPSGLMTEPSVAGLVVLAAAAGCFISAHWARTLHGKLFLYIFCVFLVSISILTKTTHLFTFFLTIVIISAVSRIAKPTQIVTLSVFSFAVYWVVGSDEHYLSRIDLANAADNLSLLVWLHGFDQMVASLTAYPLSGVGAGGTGQFDFYSLNGQYLARSGLADLNLLDAYSGMFRLVIELGPVLMLFVLIAIVRRLGDLWEATGDGSLPRGGEAQSQMFLFTFAVCLLAGIMLKEPTYSLSQFAVACLLFALVPLRVPPSGPDQRFK